MAKLMSDILLCENDTLIADAGEGATDNQIVAALVRDADWSETGPREVLELARKYGTSILRNPLALASAMNIEDGDSGM